MTDPRYPSYTVDVHQMVSIPIRAAGSEIHTEVYLYTFSHLPDRREHILLGFGDFPKIPVPLVRVHSECLTGDVFGSLRCDCGLQLAGALQLLQKEGGCLIYLRQEGRGIGLYRKLQAYRLQDEGLDTFEANRRLGFGDDLRDYRSAAGMLKALGVTEIRLITNNPDKIRQLQANGIVIKERLSTPAYVNPHNRRYLATKQKYGKHLFAEISPQ
jgi:GTP cyclohydrolase II